MIEGKAKVNHSFLKQCLKIKSRGFELGWFQSPHLHAHFLNYTRGILPRACTVIFQWGEVLCFAGYFNVSCTFSLPLSIRSILSFEGKKRRRCLHAAFVSTLPHQQGGGRAYRARTLLCLVLSSLFCECYWACIQKEATKKKEWGDNFLERIPF